MGTLGIIQMDDGDACPDVAGIAGGDGGNGCPPADDDGDGVSNALDDCPNTAGTAVGPDGCEKDTPIDEPTNPSTQPIPTKIKRIPTRLLLTTTPQNSGDDGSTDTDATQSESEFGHVVPYNGIIEQQLYSWL